jgi:hypothetical protein
VISSNHLEPGDLGRIQATVDTTGRSGILVKKISIYSNDRITPVRTIVMTMDIIQKPLP